MLNWAHAFLLIAIIAGLLRINGLASEAEGLADTVILVTAGSCFAIYMKSSGELFREIRRKKKNTKK